MLLDSNGCLFLRILFDVLLVLKFNFFSAFQSMSFLVYLKYGTVWYALQVLYGLSSICVCSYFYIASLKWTIVMWIVCLEAFKGGGMLRVLQCRRYAYVFSTPMSSVCQRNVAAAGLQPPLWPGWPVKNHWVSIRGRLLMLHRHS